MTRVVRLEQQDKGSRIGVWDGNDVIGLLPAEFARDFTDLIRLSRETGTPIDQLLDKEPLEPIQVVEVDGTAWRWLTPVGAPEVWACGVTYERSKTARNEETKGAADYYNKVYDADRPEIFFKATPSRVAQPYDAVGIRKDSNWMVPEPELVLVITREGCIVGYTVGNDMSSRDIEGENPLYLPQAKMFARCASYGPAIMLPQDNIDIYQRKIRCQIERDGRLMYEGEASTSQLKRKLEDLVAYLIRHNPIEDGTVVMTGTCLVPPDDFSLQHGDRIEIEIEGIGTLVNPVIALD